MTRALVEPVTAVCRKERNCHFEWNCNGKVIRSLVVLLGLTACWAAVALLQCLACNYRLNFALRPTSPLHYTTATGTAKSIQKRSDIRVLEVTDVVSELLNVDVDRATIQQNVTCTRTTRFPCPRKVTVPFYTWCLYRTLFSYVRRRCLRTRNELLNMTCEKEVKYCCDGYSVGPSGFCETTRDWGCGAPWLLKNTTGIFTTPGYPQAYAHEMECRWRIVGDLGTRVLLKILDLQLEEPVGTCDLEKGNCFNLCLFDVFEIIDTAENRRRTICGKLIPPKKIISAGNQLDLRFRSDSSGTGRGVKLSYSVLSANQIDQHGQCLTGQVWKLCRRVCILNCNSYVVSTRRNPSTICSKDDGTTAVVKAEDFDDVLCVPGCECPDHLPIYNNGKCDVIERCDGTDFNCGLSISYPMTKILGGETSRKGAWPWMVQVTSNDLHTDCGATLICLDWVVTAAHCFVDRFTWTMPRTIDLNLFWFHVGKYWKSTQMDRRKIQVFRAKQIIVHPNYDFENDRDDIAIVRLDGFVTHIEHVRPLCLPRALHHQNIINFTSNDNFRRSAFPHTGEMCVATGWGVTKNQGPAALRLKQILLPIKSPESCNSHPRDYAKVLCAGGLLLNDTCKGDSGGPLMCMREGRWRLDGVTSYGEGCGRGIPGGYTRISNYVMWIRRYVGPHCGNA